MLQSNLQREEQQLQEKDIGDTESRFTVGSLSACTNNRPILWVNINEIIILWLK
jgi:hypothetical protein